MISNFATQRILYGFVPINFIYRSLYKHCYKIVNISREYNVDLLNIKRIASSLNIHCPLKQSESRITIMAFKGCKSHHATISYEDMMEVMDEFSGILIDVREQEEIAETGSIPNSINIPLGELEEALVNTPDDKFKEKYGIDKPVKYHNLVFSCHSGKRSLRASQKAYALGYCNSQSYGGGWQEWSKINKVSK